MSLQSEPSIIKGCKFCHGSIDDLDRNCHERIDRQLPVDRDCHETAVTISEAAMAAALSQCGECPYGEMCVPEGCKF